MLPKFWYRVIVKKRPHKQAQYLVKAKCQVNHILTDRVSAHTPHICEEIAMMQLQYMIDSAAKI